MRRTTILDPDLYRKCLSHFRDAVQFDFVVRKGIPIPFFGDLEAYLKSPRRILTAALNPSLREFPEDQARFDVELGLSGPAELEKQLSDYFKNNPYRSWFSSFEPLLNGLFATYGGKMANGNYASTALHVDMCSPVATSPTWTGLTLEQRSELTTVGKEIFEWLIDELEPHIVVASVGWAHLANWNSQFRGGKAWECCVRHDTSAEGALLRVPLRAQVGTMLSSRGRSIIFVNASAADKPLGRFTTERKFALGKALIGLLGDPL